LSRLLRLDLGEQFHEFQLAESAGGQDQSERQQKFVELLAKIETQ